MITSSRFAPLAIALTLLVCAAPAASAGEPSLSLGLLIGTARPDGSLENYQWVTAATPAWGAAARAERGLYGVGFEVWTNRTTQHIDATQNALVRTTRLEVVGSRRLAHFGGGALQGRLGGGLMLLGYHPGRVTVDGGSGPIEVELESIRTWTGGAGLALERPIHDAWSAGLALDYHWYGLDTASRQGSSIEEAREIFGDWSARLELTRRFSMP